MQLDVTNEQYEAIESCINHYWDIKENLQFNFMGLFSMLLFAEGIDNKDCFFCSQWVATILQDSVINLFGKKPPRNIKPFDFYHLLKDYIIYEGLATNYP